MSGPINRSNSRQPLFDQSGAQSGSGTKGGLGNRTVTVDNHLAVPSVHATKYREWAQKKGWKKPVQSSKVSSSPGLQAAFMNELKDHLTRSSNSAGGTVQSPASRAAGADNLVRPSGPAPKPGQMRPPKLIAATIANDVDPAGSGECRYKFRLFPRSAKKTTDNPKGLGGMEQLRRWLRSAHGYDRDAAKADIAGCKFRSPLYYLDHGQDLYIWREKSETDGSILKPTDGRTFLTLNGADVKTAQESVQTWVDDCKISDAEVEDIMSLKAGTRDLKVPDRFYKNRLALRAPRAYRQHLEKKAEHIVVRSTIFMTHQPNGELLDKPREHVVYHACYPRLNGGSPDQRYFATGRTGKAQLRSEKTGELQDRYKATILQQLKVASANGEDIDLQMPNAFLSGLKPEDQELAKLLFEKALFEAAKEAKADPNVYGGLKAIYVHNGKRALPSKKSTLSTKLDIPKDLEDFVFLNRGDAFAPDRISHHEDKGRRVAVCIMSDGLGKVGNGALGKRANRAMEENIARLCSGTVEASGPAFNQHCTEDKNRRKFAEAKAG